MRKFTLLMLLACAVAFGGCGGKKNKSKTADDADAGLEPEAQTGPTEYPTPPSNTNARNPNRFKISVKKAYVLPLAEDGACFDACSKEVKDLYVETLPNLAGEQFGSAAKAMVTAVGAKGGKETLPDVYVHIDCGSNQEFTTHKTSAENQLTARWRGAEETLSLDPNDQCAVSVWDGDEDGQDELIGDTVANLIQSAQGGVVLLSSEQADFGQVYLVELFLEQLDGNPVMAPAGSGGGQTAAGGSGDSTASSGGSGSTGATSGGTSAASGGSGGSGTYAVEIVKATAKEKKKDGQPWDAKIPFVGKAGDVAPDLFVKAHLNGYKTEKPFMTTNPVSNSVNATWGTTGEVAATANDKLHFFVWDKDKLDHDAVGECITDTIGSLPLGQEITLQNCGQVDSIVVKVTSK